MKRFLPITYHLSFINFRNFLVFSLFLLFSVQFIKAQENEQKDTAPPPLKILSKDEAKQLNAEADVKRRTRLALDLMEIRLKKAEELNAQKKYAEMFNELGDFNALIDKTLEYLDKNDNGRGKVLNDFKRVEMSLRTFLPRLELIRRDLPLKYEFYVRSLAKDVRAARSKAIEPFFGNTVIKDNTN